MSHLKRLRAITTSFLWKLKAAKFYLKNMSIPTSKNTCRTIPNSKKISCPNLSLFWNLTFNFSVLTTILKKIKFQINEQRPHEDFFTFLMILIFMILMTWFKFFMKFFCFLLMKQMTYTNVINQTKINFSENSKIHVSTCKNVQTLAMQMIFFQLNRHTGISWKTIKKFMIRKKECAVIKILFKKRQTFLMSSGRGEVDRLAGFIIRSMAGPPMIQFESHKFLLTTTVRKQMIQKMMAMSPPPLSRTSLMNY